MHLHGSPLFYSDKNQDGKILKDSYEEFNKRNLYKNKNRNHLVLTHYDYKPQIITKSSLLDTYWDYFRYAIQTSNNLILFGYSGCDKHLNILISEWKNIFKNSHLEIVEYKTDVFEPERQEFWAKNLNIKTSEFELKRLSSILNYRLNQTFF